MSLHRIQDRIRWGLNVAARHVGSTADAYRPSSTSAPTAACNRYLRLHAAFSGPDNRFLRPSGYGTAIWHGVFDAAYTRVGDYLVQNGDVWFIAAQQDLLPVLCVKADRVVSFSRSDAPSSAGVNTYSGVTTATNTPLLTDWPASILGVGGSGLPRADLPSDQSVPYWTVLMPAYGEVILLPGDLMQDDLGRECDRRGGGAFITRLAHHGPTVEHLMADQSDVENALVTLVSAALYPDGTDGDSVPGPVCRIYRGWPKSAALNADLAAGRINVTVFPATPGMRNTTRYPDEWMTNALTPALTVVVTGNVVAFAGAASIGQLAGVRVDGRSYAYRTIGTDTPAAVAGNIAALARADGIVGLAYATLTFLGAGEVLARVVADASGVMEIRRQVQSFRIICWCPTPLLRDAVATAIDVPLATMRFITLSDGTAARLIFSSSTVFDQSQDAILYRRDLLYSVEYATTLTALQPSMLFGSLDLNSATFIA